MKKLISMLMAGVLCLSLAACGSSVDKQPAIDAFNSTNTAFTELANRVNANIDVYPDEMIEGLTTLSDALAEKKALLEGDQALTEEDVSTLVTAFQDIDTLIANTNDAVTAFEKALVKEPAVQAFNAASDVYDALANDINVNTANYPDDIIADIQEMGEALAMTKELLESDQELSDEQIAAIVEQMNTNEAVLQEVAGLFMNQIAPDEEKVAVAEYLAELYFRYDALANIITEDFSLYTDDFLNEFVAMAEGFDAYAADLQTDDLTGEALSRIAVELTGVEAWLSTVESELLG